ncbi:HWE histidine kinase domain-containing protein [Roseococcus sp.]|uniref:HWE histidine kinase domain-containing protein n=1 Tax=Roseococcus sp. TaxID=2109646 RepID=UPI003BAC7D3E
MSLNYGEPITLTNCDREPIHRLGHIQPFGFLLAADSDGVVRNVSKNIEIFIGVPAQVSLGRRLADLIVPETYAAIHERTDDLTELPVAERLFGVPLREGGTLYDVAVHMADGWLVVEAERSTPAGNFDPTADVRFLMAQFDQASGLLPFCHIAAERLQALLGYDRVMVYRFDDDASGEVIAEVARPGIGSFLGQRYPKEDIPQQARVLYLKNWLRIIADVNAAPVPVQGGGNDAQSIGLDLSLSTLRAVSPVHLEYLRNMGVSASLSISIVVQGRLWGLFACHHYSPRLVDFRRRSAAELFGRMFSLLVDSRERSEEAEHEAHARTVHDRVMARIAVREDAAKGIQDLLPEIADTIPSDGVALILGAEITLLGHTPTQAELADLLAALPRQEGATVLSEESIPRLYPPAAAWTERATGMLVVPLSQAPRDYLIYFRLEYARTVVWGGEPAKIENVGPLGVRLTPRASFDAWKEVVRGRSAPWTALERRIAASLQVGLLDIILRLSEAAHEQRRLAAERQKLLIAELNHRVRNILALISGLVKQTQAGTAADFASQIEGRIEALARAHDQITRDNWGPAPLRALLQAETGTYAQRVVLSGPEVSITPLAFSTLALVLHELVTNSAKYGALSAPSGRVEIRWYMEADGQLALEWGEHGGPPVQAPQRRGFGSSFIERAIPFDLHGEARIHFAVAGVSATFVIPRLHVVDTPGAKEIMALGVPTARSSTNEVRNALVVEDNFIIALDAQSMLKHLGVPKVEVASNVTAALRRIAQDVPDFVVLDFNLGRESSVPVAEELERRGIPFVFATGYGEDADILGLFPERPVLRKPYTRADLKAFLTGLANP